MNSNGLSATRLVDRDTVGDPAIDAAKTAAMGFFSGRGSAHSARADDWSDPAARSGVPRVEAARPAEVLPLQRPATDLLASVSPQSNGQTDKPRSGRILQGLTVEDPIDALLRREAEEKSARRRGPRVRRVPVATEIAVPTSSRQIPVHKTIAKSASGFAEPTASTGPVEPGRKLQGRMAVTEHKPAVDADKTEPRRRKKLKAPRRGGRLGRTANGRAGAKRRAQKRAAGRGLGKKGVARRTAVKRAAATKHGGRTAVARKTALRKGAAKTTVGRLARKRSAAKRTVTTASAGKTTSRRAAKTKTSAARTTKTGSRARKPGSHKARRSR